MPGSTPVDATVEASATVVTLCAARHNRRSVLIHNNSVEDLYVYYGSGASLTQYTVIIPAGWYGRMPWGENYVGVITGIWENADPTGFARVTEMKH